MGALHFLYALKIVVDFSLSHTYTQISLSTHGYFFPESCQVKLSGKILEKIPMKKTIFSKVAGF